MKKLILLLFLVTIQANSQTNFTGAYDIQNWTFTNVNADGNVNTTNAPNSISLTGGDNQSNTMGDTNYIVTTPAAGTISFNWAYSTTDGSNYDFPNIITSVNGVKTLFPGYDFYGSQIQSGIISLNVNAGEQFGFNFTTTDNIGNAATITISNFNFSPLVIFSSKIRSNQCGSTLAMLNANIAADYVPGYEAYRFEVTNGATVNTVDMNKYNFNLLKTPGIAYGTTYGVRVAVKKGGVWSAFGASCDITTPMLNNAAVPTTKVKPTFCGTTLATLSTKIPAVPVYLADGYRFEITKDGEVTEYDSPSYNFKLSQSGVVVANASTYSIRVAARINGIYGSYGPSCDVFTANSADKQSTGNIFAASTDSNSSRQINEDVDFSLVAYPNPSNGIFKLQINGANEEIVSILVYDMMGKQIENKVVNNNDIENISLGQNYSTGIYNVIVSQGTNTKTVRLVKN